MLTIKWHKLDFQKKWTFRKSRPRTYRKSGPYAKTHCIGQKHLYDKLEVADFKYDDNFLNLKPKITETRHFWFQVWKYFVLHKTLLNDIFKGAEYACICVKFLSAYISHSSKYTWICLDMHKLLLSNTWIIRLKLSKYISASKYTWINYVFWICLNIYEYVQCA